MYILCRAERRLPMASAELDGECLDCIVLLVLCVTGQCVCRPLL